MRSQDGVISCLHSYKNWNTAETKQLFETRANKTRNCFVSVGLLFQFYVSCANSFKGGIGLAEMKAIARHFYRPTEEDNNSLSMTFKFNTWFMYFFAVSHPCFQYASRVYAWVSFDYSFVSSICPTWAPRWITTLCRVLCTPRATGSFFILAEATRATAIDILRSAAILNRWPTYISFFLLGSRDSSLTSRVRCAFIRRNSDSPEISRTTAAATQLLMMIDDDDDFECRCVIENATRAI